MALTALRVFNRFVIVALLALVACLGMCLTGTAWAQCSIIPVAPPPLSANFSGLTFTPASPYFLGFAGLVGCEGAKGDTDDDGMPGFAGQPAAQVAGTSSGLTIIGAPPPPVTFAPTTAALISAIGGGGGTGGEAGVPIFSPTNGGTGGAGGAGQAITVAFSGNFVPDPATGLGSTALLAQSFGGPGGGGGGTHTFDSGGKFGGDGGAGGAGGPVSLTASGTASALSLGVAGVSVGGFGGAGSDASSSADVLSTATGGNGGNGGAGGDVAVQWTGGAITTQSQGINAFSAGGEAGSGGAATSATGLQGGNGATGGTAGAASAILAAGSVAITLDPPTGPVDSVSFGVAAQSLGGPGGDGGLAGTSLGSGGGNGGNGGAGGPASVTILGAVTYGVTGALPTDPVSGYALLVQSNGGIGGNGAGASGLAGEAGGGGFAGTGGRADLTLGNTSGTAAIRSAGNHAHGALVQSVGGGGGNGGQANFAIGGGSAGSGQAGGNGGAVNIAAPAASVIASGPNSAIMVAQSIGGGGGTGGDIQDITVAASIAIGGNGGLGGNGGAVDVTLGSGIFGSTSTIGGAGVLAQSIGGSGGVAGSASATGTGLLSLTIGGDAGGGGLGGPVTIANGGLVTTYGDHAAGIQAQSIGGGGGKGGSAVTFIAGALPTAAVAVGGRGGSGGPAGEVTVANTAQVTTYGPDAAGILLQSVGGGGGSGGASAARAVALSPDKRIPAISIAVAIGGKGGSGNIGGTVRLDNSGLITTAGHGAYGVIAQSIGGGGGTGGDSTAAAYSGGNTGDGIAISIATAVGGGGGTGALGGAVTLNNAGLILTLGQDAYGVFAQSIGGGGGTGGGGDASAASNEAKFSFSTSIGVGGSGGSGGTANTVGLTNTGSITTRGDGSDGVFAQSIGGGGGTAGGGTATASGGTVSVAVGVGGTGGAGGDGRAVTIANAGGIVTRGADSVGIFAQSIGGGGGKGGKGAATAGGVTTLSNVQALYDTLAAGLNFNQSVTTVADFILQIGQIGENIKSQIDELKGILAQPQALAGGGEEGQGSKIDIQVNVGTAVAGKGGGGGQGGPVNTSNTGQVITFGAQSDGILAQSVGGGGGKGGAASSVGAASDDTPVQTTVSVGGGGGSAGGGGAVSVDNGKGGAILTQGVLAMGVVAQSIGGGGGVGSVAGTVDGSLKSLGVGLGGSGGAGGAGGAVTVTTGDGTAASSIATTGKHGIAILAQSIGGGGGLAKTMTTDQTFDPAKILNNPQGRVADIQGLSVDLGGQGGAAGDGGPVAVDASGPVTTLGLGAHGIAAQSIGAGGGLVAGGQFLGPIHVGGPVGGVGGGGPVAIQLQAGAAIATSGDGAYGLLAQSIGGGGGVAGDPSVGATASGSAFTSPVTTYVRDIPASVRTPGIGNGGDVGVSLANASIRTSGVYAPAVFAQTVGGGGGLIVQKNGDTARTIYRGSSGGGGTAGQIRVDLKSSIVAATGIGSAGILAQATGTATGAIMITLDTSSAVQGGTPDPNAGGQSPEQRDSAAIRILGGTGNTIVNDGAITANLSGGTRGYAILADSDRVTVTNAGTIVGDIKTGAFGQLDNLAGGIIAAPRAIDVGGGTVRNAGVLQPGGAGSIGTTTINGDYVQSATGTLVVDIARERDQCRPAAGERQGRDRRHDHAGDRLRIDAEAGHA